MDLTPQSSTRVRLLLIFIVFLSLAGGGQTSPSHSISRDAAQALDSISARSLRGHLSFIASDLLEGRDTPSRGLDIAAEYIAAQFRRAGLEVVGDDEYFQTAHWLLAERDLADFALEVRFRNRTLKLEKEQTSLYFFEELKLTRAPILKVNYLDRASVAALTSEQVAGKVIMAEYFDYRREAPPRREELVKAYRDFFDRTKAIKPALVILVDRVKATGRPTGLSQLIDPEARPPQRQTVEGTAMVVHDPRVVALYDSLREGHTGAHLSVNLPGIVERPVKLRNVVGLLRGSDPAFAQTCVLLTAHYDHIGMRQGTEGDLIFNGANDNGSGTVSIIELATVFAGMKQRPKRSILFVAFFGEEHGLRGSRFYARHPILPIEKTVANINLEQVGRTDSSEGPQVATATLTGFDYSDIGAVFKAAGELTAVRVYKHPVNSDSHFSRSDNQALADLGVPAHTLCVAFSYPDYHRPGDHWDKIDYENMARVNRLIGTGILMIADSPEEPKWNESNPRAARYLKAWRDRRGL